MASRITRRALLGAATLLAPALAARAAGYPDRPVRLIVPFAPGGGTDLAARLIMSHVSEGLGQPVVVENRGGAGGDIAMLAAAAAPADGYTLVFGNDGANARGPAMRESVPYDPARAFTPVARLVDAWSAFVVHDSVPVGSMAEFVAYARTHPGELNYGSSGQGTLAHVTVALFAHEQGLDVVHVPYRGAALAAQDLAAGRLQFSFLTAGGLVPILSGPTLKVLGVSGAQPQPAFSRAPTMTGAGFPVLDILTWYGVFAPVGTPSAIVEVLARHLEAAIADPAIRARLQDQCLIPAFLPTGRFGAFVAQQREKWREVSARTGIRL